MAAMVFVPSSKGEHGQGGRADVMDLDWEVVVVGDETPPRTDAVERVGVNGGGGDAVLEKAPWMAPQGTPQALASEAPRVAASQATPTVEPSVAPQAAPAAELVVVL